MTPIKIDNFRYDLPDCWPEVKYSQYVELLSVGDCLTGFLNLFTGLSKEYLLKANIDACRAWEILSFLNTPPEFKPKPTHKVGPYKVRQIVITSVGQLCALHELLKKAPSPVVTIEDNILVADMYLEASAIYTTKSKYGTYEESKVQEVKEELRDYSCIETLQTGAYFLFWVLKIGQRNQLN